MRVDTRRTRTHRFLLKTNLINITSPPAASAPPPQPSLWPPPLLNPINISLTPTPILKTMIRVRDGVPVLGCWEESRADEVDDWAAGKKSTLGNGFERQEREWWRRAMQKICKLAWSTLDTTIEQPEVSIQSRMGHRRRRFHRFMDDDPKNSHLRELEGAKERLILENCAQVAAVAAGDVTKVTVELCESARSGVKASSDWVMERITRRSSRLDFMIVSLGFLSALLQPSRRFKEVPLNMETA